MRKEFNLSIVFSDGHIFYDEDVVAIVKRQVIFQKAQGKSLEAIKEYVLNYNDFDESDSGAEIEKLVAAFFYEKKEF
jgi:DNA-binding transcriptional MerR regulator